MEINNLDKYDVRDIVNEVLSDEVVDTTNWCEEGSLIDRVAKLEQYVNSLQALCITLANKGEEESEDE